MKEEVLLVDLASQGGLGDELHGVLGASCRLTRVQGSPGGIPWDNGFAASLVAGRTRAIFLVTDSGLGGAADAVEALGSRLPDVPILLVADSVDPEALVEVLEVGVRDFVAPPLTRAQVLARYWRAVQRRPPGQAPPTPANPDSCQPIGASPAFAEVLAKLPLLAGCDATVLIEGETGTGKDVCARAIHESSRRARGPFVPVNCGAIPTELVANELFGHERSAYTGATSSRDGLVREANSGTLFLDEVDCLPPAAQVKLLRLLQEREYRPLGSHRICKADVRFIAATNTNIELAVSEGRLRKDLYYRLEVLPLALPPLRARGEDVLLLAEHFLARFTAERGAAPIELTPAACHALLTHTWPGNVRELEHVLERSVVLADGRSPLGVAALQLDTKQEQRPDSFRLAKARAVESFERGYVESLLRVHRGNITHAAAAAQKNRRAFFELMRKHGIDAERFRRTVRAPIRANGARP